MAKALSVSNVSKQYRIYDRPGDRLKETLTRGRWKAHREFWALHQVSFELEAGTTTGIVGPNGCGKSTLLQIIAGTLEPTHGHVRYEGRVAALLELGAGFDTEFTGIENIYLSAALYGFSRRRTESLLPEIERFAEIGPFVHQPVKTYSSGMYVRLAFAIAVNVDPQILLVDEALAVGDATFQHRCLRRIKEMQEKGTTILFVSHDLGAVRALCSRAILLNAGAVVIDGKPADVLNRYQRIIMAREEAYESHAQVPTVEREPSPEIEEAEEEECAPLHYTYRHGDGSAEILSVALLDASLRPIELVETGEAVYIRMRVRFHKETEEPVFGIIIRNRLGIHIYGTNTRLQEVSVGQVGSDETVEVSFAFNCRLGTDNFNVAVAVHSADGVSFDWVDGALFFQVMSATAIEGVANLGASVTARRLGAASRAVDETNVNVA
jgi:ABC-type polysaccharide/polyol phosphate transport system ATPase subunit